MNEEILDQLARTQLLPDDLSKAILEGNTPPLETIVMALVITTMDCHACTSIDLKSSLIDKRSATVGLAIAFLTAMALTSQTEDSGGRL